MSKYRLNGYSYSGSLAVDFTNKTVVKLSRIISSDPNGIYSTKYAIVYFCNTENTLKVIFLTDYDNTLVEQNTVSISDLKQARSIIYDWEDEECKCDGGFSSYRTSSTKTRSRFINY